MNNYLITLTPIDRFYFGGETTFRRTSREEKKESKEEITEFYKQSKAFDEAFGSYVVKSNLFPQQTSLLGMLRFLILSNNPTVFKNNKILENQKKSVGELIGKNSFQFSTNNLNELDFGLIKSISPCFIQRKTNHSDWEKIDVSPMDHKLQISFKDKTPIIDNYSAKNGLNNCYLGNDTSFEEKDLFKEDVRIGIDRKFDGKVQEDAYYKQIFLKFTKNYKNKDKKELNHTLRFAFYAQLSEADSLLNKKHIVSLGGDTSRFILEVEEQKEDEPQLPLLYDSTQLKNCVGKVILDSDAYIEKETLKYCLFHISDVIPFRFLMSSINTTNYYSFKGNTLERSKKLFFYKRGSVFYFENTNNMTKFKAELKKYKQLYQIGYNHIITI